MSGIGAIGYAVSQAVTQLGKGGDPIYVSPAESEYPLLPYIEEHGWHNPPSKEKK